MVCGVGRGLSRGGGRLRVSGRSLGCRSCSRSGCARPGGGGILRHGRRNRHQLDIGARDAPVGHRHPHRGVTHRKARLALGRDRVLARRRHRREAAVGARDRAHDGAGLQLDESHRHAGERPALELHASLDRAGRGRRSAQAGGTDQEQRHEDVGRAAQGTHAPRS